MDEEIKKSLSSLDRGRIECVTQRNLSDGEMLKIEALLNKRANHDISEIFNNYNDLLKSLVETRKSIPCPADHLGLCPRPYGH